MTKTVIIGTGAVAAELTAYISDNNKIVAEELKREIIGYIDYDYNVEKYWRKYNLSAPVIGDIDSFDFSQNIEVLIGISDINFRNKIIAIVKEKNGVFGQFIHSSVIFSKQCEIGIGNIIYPFCIVGPNTKIGNFNLITSYSFISHDTIIGNGNFCSTVGIAGRVSIGNDNFFGIRSTILPDIVIGDRNVIQAGMIVDKSVENSSTVFYKYKERIISVPK